MTGEVTYENWASVYEAFEGAASYATWRQGIARDLDRLGCKDHQILDLGAGTGIGRRVLLEAFPACNIVSLDRSQAMLDIGGVPSDMRIVGDMSRFEVAPGTYDFVVSGFDALNCLSRYQLAACFASTASALKARGKLVFDYSSRQLLKYEWHNLVVERSAGDMRLAVSHAYDSSLDRTAVNLQLIDAGRTLWTEHHHHYTVDPFLVQELAAAAGMTVLYVRDIDREAFSPSSTTHVYVLERKTDA